MGQRLFSLPHFHFLRSSPPHPATGFRESPSLAQPHKTTILSRNSIAACIENDHLNNSVDEGAIKRDKQPGRKEQFFTINDL